MDVIRKIEQEQLKDEVADFNVGDAVKVHTRVREGGKERIQIFRGNVIQIKGHGATKTFTVRKISGGIGVERIFPLLSPNIAEIQVLKRGRVRRARLFYLRDAIGQKAKIKERKYIKPVK